MRKFILSIFFLSAFISGTNAQLTKQKEILQSKTNWPKSIAFYASVGAGKIWVHTPKFKPDASMPIFGFEVGINKQTFGSKDWQAKYKYPEIQLGILYNNFNSPKILGEAWAAMFGINFKLINRPKWQLGLGMGEGMAYITKKFDFISNPTNNVIGSHYNEVTQFKLNVHYAISNRIKFYAKGSFTHYSNARFTSPNLGINAITGHVGLQYFVSKSPLNYRPKNNILLNKKIQYNVKFGFAMAESNLWGGPKYPSYSYYMGLSKRLGYCNRVHTGLWFEYNQGVRDDLNFLNEPLNSAEISATKAAIQIGDELIFGRVSLVGNVGLYIFQGIQKNYSSYQNLGLNYVLYTFNKPKNKEIYVGMQLKTHYGIAQYFETYLGIRF